MFAIQYERMDLSKIITVTGRSGLYRVVAQGRQAVIAESLEDGKRVPVHSSVRVSSLDEISMFTTGEDVPLKDVLTKLHEKSKGGAAADPESDDEELWKQLTAVLPNADKERIYASHVRKLFQWYAQLLKANVFAEKEEEEKEEGGERKEEGKARKAAEKSTKAKADITAKKGGAKAGGPPKAAAPRRGGQRGS
jgi:hypothetical protein